MMESSKLADPGKAISSITGTTCAAYLHLSSSVLGGAAEHAADRKRNKYEFVPIAVETLGPINREGCEFLLELGRRGAGVSGDPRETVFLFQRLSVCIQRLEAPSHRTLRKMKSLLDYITVI